jgi:branched-chain amino acid transport system substrate-binding protein
MVRKHARRRAGVGLGLAVAMLLATTALATTGGASVPAADDGVTPKAIKIWFIYRASVVVALISAIALGGFDARIGRQNAAGGINGRKIEIVSRDDASSGANLTAAQDLVENEHVFAVVNASPFAFLSYRFLLDQGVPMIGNGADGTYYQQKGNEDILSSAGNGLPFGDTTYDTPARAMKMAGAKKVGVLAYGAASSSVATAKAFMAYAVPGVGLDPVYTNTSVDFGTSDVGPLVLGIKNAGVDAVYLPMAASTNIAVAQGLEQAGVNMKATILATGYGQDFLDSPAAATMPPSALFSAPGKPVELKDPATKRFQADLKKYAKVTGVPDFGQYSGYEIGDFAVVSLLKAGSTPTRRGLIDGWHSRQLRRGGARVRARRRQPRGAGQDAADDVRLARPGQERQVRAVPQERQADHRQARRHTGRPRGSQGRRHRDADHGGPDHGSSVTQLSPWGKWIIEPPSTTRVRPVMNPDNSDSRTTNGPALPSGLPPRARPRLRSVVRRAACPCRRPAAA